MAADRRHARRGISRRSLLAGAGGVGFVGVSAAVLPLFSTPDRKQDPATCRAADLSARNKHLVISNWPEFIDTDTKHYKSTLTRFEEHYGVRVTYLPEINDNVQFFAKVVNQLGSCSSTKRDMFVLTDWMAARMIKMGWIQPLAPASVPNLHKNLLPSLRSPDWDPDRRYSAPWQSGFTGIGYNKKYLSNPPGTIKELLTRRDLKGKISVLTEMRDTMGLVMLSQGIDPAHFTAAEWSRSIEVLQRAKSSGQIRAFEGNEYLDDLAVGNIVACMVWSGDMASSGDKNLEFVVPEDGMMIWSDNMIVPNLTPHLSLAQKWVNWYYDPYIAALLADYNRFVSPVEGARGQMEKINPEAVANPLIFPTEDYLMQAHLFMALQEYQIRNYEGDFAYVSGA